MSNNDSPTSSMHRFESLPDAKRHTKRAGPRFIEKMKGAQSSDKEWIDDIEEELALSETTLSCYCFGTLGQSGIEYYFDSAGTDSRELSRDDSSKLLFSIGSVIKLLIAVCITFLIDYPHDVQKALNPKGLEEIPHPRDPNKPIKLQRLPADAWSQNAFKLLEAARKSRGSQAEMYVPDGTKFTLLDVMTHCNALPSMQDLLFGLQSTFLMTMEWFVAHVGEIYADERKNAGETREFGYSNANYIFLGALIEAVTDLDLATALQMIVLDHAELKMENTVLSVAKYESLVNLIVEGRFIDPDTSRQPRTVKDSTYLQNSAPLACCGGFSCTKDIASLLGFLMRNKEEEGWQRIFEIRKDIGHLWTLSGQGCSLNDRFTTEQSFERCLLGPDEFKSQDRKSVLQILRLEKEKFLIVKAGTVTGYSSVYYLFPVQNVFIIVLSNSSGIIDSASRIAHILAKYCLRLNLYGNLQESRVELLKARRRRMKECILGVGNHVPLPDKFWGRYKHAPSGQVVVVDRNTIQIVGTPGSDPTLSETHSVVSLGQTKFAIWTEPGLRGLDRYDAWRYPEMEFIDNGTARCKLKLQSRCYEWIGPVVENAIFK